MKKDSEEWLRAISKCHSKYKKGRKEFSTSISCPYSEGSVICFDINAIAIKRPLFSFLGDLWSYQFKVDTICVAFDVAGGNLHKSFVDEFRRISERIAGEWGFKQHHRRE